MMFVRYLAVLGALAMAHPSDAAQPKKVEWCHVQKLSLPPKAVASHAANHPFDFPATADGQCITGIALELYDEGCPCFNQEDVDEFLIYAAGVKADGGYCSYSDTLYPEGRIVELAATGSYNSRQLYLYDDTSSDGDNCYMTLGEHICPGDLEYCVEGVSSAAFGPRAFSDCVTLIEAVEDEMSNLRCTIVLAPP